MVLVLQGYAGDQAAEVSGIAVSHVYARPVYAHIMSAITIVRYSESAVWMIVITIIGAAGKQDAREFCHSVEALPPQQLGC